MPISTWFMPLQRDYVTYPEYLSIFKGTHTVNLTHLRIAINHFVSLNVDGPFALYFLHLDGESLASFMSLMLLELPCPKFGRKHFVHFFQSAALRRY